MFSKLGAGKKVSWLSLVFILGISATGCGSSEPHPYYPPNPGPIPPMPLPPSYPYPYYPSCPAGQIWIWGFCYAQPTFQEACVWGGGTYHAATSSKPALCQNDRIIPPGTIMASTSTNGFPRLNPSAPLGPRSFETTIYVHPGDRLTFKGTGRWNDDMSDVGCDNSDSVNLDGFKNGIQVLHEGLPQGWVGSDGTGVFEVGSETTTPISMTHQGLLRVGFNAPLAPDYCYKLSIETFKVTHCEDTMGITHACP